MKPDFRQVLQLVVVVVVVVVGVSGEYQLKVNSFSDLHSSLFLHNTVGFGYNDVFKVCGSVHLQSLE
jgi:hypothetical protein